MPTTDRGQHRRASVRRERVARGEGLELREGDVPACAVRARSGSRRSTRPGGGRGTEGEGGEPRGRSRPVIPLRARRLPVRRLRARRLPVWVLPVWLLLAALPGPAIELLGELPVGPAPLQAQESGEREERAAERAEERISRVTVRNLGSPVAEAGYLGVGVEDVDAEAAAELGLEEVEGARVTEVARGSPAAGAGLREDDVIVAWDGESVRSVAALTRLVRETPPGRGVEVRYVRDGSRRTASVEVGERPARPLRLGFRAHTLDDEKMERMRESLEEARERIRDLDMEVIGDGGRFHVRMTRPRLGVRLQSLGDQLAGYFGVGDRGGSLVVSVREGSAAASAGLRAGDVIVAVDGEEVDDPGEVSRAIRRAEAGPLPITVVRGGEEREITVELPERSSPTREPAPARGPGASLPFFAPPAAGFSRWPGIGGRLIRI